MSWLYMGGCHFDNLQSQSDYKSFNPLHAKFFRGNINIYLHFVSFLHIDMTQVVESLGARASATMILT